jgi:predicted ATPase/DNA-binding SARP family transcriptional activator
VLTVGVLGPIEVHRDGVRLEVPAGKTSELLARLALVPGKRVRADVLIEELWAGPTGRNTLQSKVSQLRRALGDKELVDGSGDSYRLLIDASSVDAARAAQLGAAAAEARTAGNAAGSLERAREGLALFRGEVLAEAGDWATAHRTELEEVRMGLVEDAMAARVDLGAGGDVVGELESLVERHPLREGLWASLITALYRSGRQADALAAYSRVRRVLVDELGVEPGRALRLLERQVLRQSPDLDPSGAARRLGAPGNLPSLTTAMVGRAEEVAAVTAALDGQRLVTVVGVAGVGKTRLALEVARQLRAPGGVWLVRLDAVDATAVLPQVVAETLHVSSGDALRERLSGAGTVLVLDNCEHVVGQVAALLDSLLDTVPHLRVLATSQVPIGVDDEVVHPLGPLNHEEAVLLFTRRAQQMRRQLVVDADVVTAIDGVCRSLDGLPLAIELAASRVRSLSVSDIASRLNDRFALLQDPNSRRPERRRALSGAIAWSYDLLFPDDQRGLWALSRFAGSASIGALEKVLAALDVPATAALDTISRLVDRSLVIVDEAGGGEVRYRLLDSIRAFAAGRLRESGGHNVAAAAHANWFADLADWCDEHVRTERQPECLAIARAERANVDAALGWCVANDPQLGVRIANGFGWTWVVLGDGSAGAERVRNALTDETPARDRARGLLLAGWLEASAGDVGLAQTDLRTAGELAELLDDEVMRADVQRHQAFLSIQQGRPDAVLASAVASLATYRALGRDWEMAGSLLLAAYGSLMVGDSATASRDASEAVEIIAPIGDSWAMVHAEAMLGGIAQAEHRFEDAARALARAADASATMGFLGQAALHRASLARVQQRLGDPAAVSSYQQAIEEAAAVGDGRLAATARLNLARLLRGARERDAAVALLEENERWYRSAGGGDYALLTHCMLSAERRDKRALTRVLAEARASQNVEVQVFALDAHALMAAEDAQTAEARALLDESDRLATQVAHVVDDSDRVDKAAALKLTGLLVPGHQQAREPLSRHQHTLDADTDLLDDL